jgi:hypothetical protein
MVPAWLVVGYQTARSGGEEGLDTLVVLLTAMFWLLLALFYPPEDHIVKVYLMDSSDEE